MLSDGELAARPSSNSGSEWDTWMNSALTYVYSFHIEETFKLGVVYVADGYVQINFPFPLDLLLQFTVLFSAAKGKQEEIKRRKKKGKKGKEKI